MLEALLPSVGVPTLGKSQHINRPSETLAKALFMDNGRKPKLLREKGRKSREFDVIVCYLTSDIHDLAEVTYNGCIYTGNLALDTPERVKPLSLKKFPIIQGIPVPSVTLGPLCSIGLLIRAVR
jgi:hypothetical protein